MPIKKVTPEEKAIREAQDKRVSDFVKEGMTIEQAKAAKIALNQTTTTTTTQEG